MRSSGVGQTMAVTAGLMPWNMPSWPGGLAEAMTPGQGAIGDDGGGTGRRRRAAARAVEQPGR